MIDRIVKLWEKNKNGLRDYIKNTKQEEYDSYEEIVKLICEKIVNKGDELNRYVTEKMTVIGKGNYQGTLIFIIPKDTYLPDVTEYIMTYVYYGSCSGCDTLQRIRSYSYDLPDEKQIDDYMILCLHLIQRMRFLAEEED